jgi:hypothetical protein
MPHAKWLLPNFLQSISIHRFGDAGGGNNPGEAMDIDAQDRTTGILIV